MKIKRFLVVALILSIVVTNFILFNHYHKKLHSTSLVVVQLTEELENLKQLYKEENQEIKSNLETLAMTLIQIEAEGQKRSASVYDYLKNLDNNIEETNQFFSRKYASLKTQTHSPGPTNFPSPSQPPTPSPTVVNDEGISLVVTDNTEKESLLIHDVKVSQFYNTGLEAFNNEEYSLAKNSFAELLEFDPPIWEAHLYYIRSAYAENPGRAVTDKTVKRLLEGFPPDMNETGQVSKYKGLLALETGDYDQGISLIEESLEINPGDKELRLLLGECYLYLKKPEKANLVFQEIISLFPDTPESGTAKTYLERSREAG